MDWECDPLWWRLFAALAKEKRGRRNSATPRCTTEGGNERQLRKDLQSSWYILTGRITALHCELCGYGRLCGYSRGGRRQLLAQAVIALLIAWPPTLLLFGRHYTCRPTPLQIRHSESQRDTLRFPFSCSAAIFHDEKLRAYCRMPAHIS